MMRMVSIFCMLLAALPAAGLAQEGTLTVVVLEGEGAFNNIKRKLARDLIVEVRDEYGKTVTGAEVVFTLPEGGPGAVFAGGSRKFTTASNASGRAQTTGLKPNSKEGRFNIKVSAAMAGKSGSTIISQSNTLAGGVVGVEKHGMSGKTKALIVALIAGGAGGGAYAATRGGGGSAAAAGPVPTSLSAGAVTVGGPR